MSETFPIKIIARIHTDFPTKFGVPRQSGLIDSLESLIIFELEYRDPLSLRGLEEFSHLCFPRPYAIPGPPPCARQSWEETAASASLPPARPSGQMPSGCPRCGFWELRSIPSTGMCCVWRGQI